MCYSTICEWGKGAEEGGGAANLAITLPRWLHCEQRGMKVRSKVTLGRPFVCKNPWLTILRPRSAGLQAAVSEATAVSFAFEPSQVTCLKQWPALLKPNQTECWPCSPFVNQQQMKQKGTDFWLNKHVFYSFLKKSCFYLYRSSVVFLKNTWINYGTLRIFFTCWLFVVELNLCCLLPGPLLLPSLTRAYLSATSADKGSNFLFILRILVTLWGF